MKSAVASANPHLKILGGISVHSSSDLEYLEYRRKWIEYPRDFIVEDFPLHLDVEITNRCNLKCTFCDRRPSLEPNDIGDMGFDLYRRIIDEGALMGLYGLKLSYRGEPLLHSRVADMVLYGKKKGIMDIYFNTNGMLLTKEMSSRLIDAGLDRISISIEGSDPVAYERERKGAKFETVLRHIDILWNLRAQRQTDRPRIRVQTVHLPGIDLPQYANFWGSHCDETAVIDYVEKTSKCSSVPVDRDWACPELWQRMTIECKGRIMPCNKDDFGYLSSGNVMDKSIAQCWRDPVVENARSLHRNGESHLVKACGACAWRRSQLLKGKSSKMGGA